MNLAKFCRINIETVLRLIILLGFALFFYLTIESGKVLLYIHPRIVPYMKFGIVAMVLISLFIARDLFKPVRRVNFAPYMFFIIPLFMAFALPAKSMDSTSMAFGNAKITGQMELKTETTSSNTKNDITIADNANNSISGSTLTSDIANNTNDNTATTMKSENTNNNTTTTAKSASDNSNGSIADDKNNSTTTDISDAADNTNDSSDLSEDTIEKLGKGFTMKNGTIIMDDDSFTRWLQEIYEKMDKYQGRKVEVTGLVFKDEQFKKNEFVPARLMMACCSADLQPVGFLCHYDKADNLKQDTWVKVTGTIGIENYKDQQIPVIIAESVVSTEKPENDYVYPYY